ncbi:hypothetical protein BGW80DRAFT_241768 [Lactifluus volemus]|nr:hypothetical protein BGW80DRAFT_241768 [Lactifluus volemus]
MRQIPFPVIVGLPPRSSTLSFPAIHSFLRFLPPQSPCIPFEGYLVSGMASRRSSAEGSRPYHVDVIICSRWRRLLRPSEARRVASLKVVLEREWTDLCGMVTTSGINGSHSGDHNSAQHPQRLRFPLSLGCPFVRKTSNFPPADVSMCRRWFFGLNKGSAESSLWVACQSFTMTSHVRAQLLWVTLYPDFAFIMETGPHPDETTRWQTYDPGNF